MKTTNYNPIWVENPYTGQQINVEPLFRFNEQMLYPLVQRKPLVRTALVLKNALFYMGQCPAKGSSSAQAMREIENEVMALIHAVEKMEVMSNQATV